MLLWLNGVIGVLVLALSACSTGEPAGGGASGGEGGTGRRDDASSAGGSGGAPAGAAGSGAAPAGGVGGGRGGSAGAGGTSAGAAGDSGGGGARGGTAGAMADGSAGVAGTRDGAAGVGGSAGTGGGVADGAPAGDSASGVDGGDIPGGGTVLFRENFDDGNFSARGWYDGPAGTISTAEHAPSSASSFECAFAPAAMACTAGKPARHRMTPTETAYASFWIKFSSNWVGSGKAYHPHMMHFINTLDDDFVGPAHTYLTTYMEVVAGKAMLALQDAKNVDLACILRNDDSFVGCNGDFRSYPFTENRSVCACNGIMGDLDGRDCFANGNGTWYSSRSWSSANAFVDSAGPNYKSDWHFVEVYFQMNSIRNGVGVADGKIRWLQDGKTLIKHDQILLRTGARASLAFKQFAMLPYIGDGSPVAQSFWLDDLTVATAKP